MFQSKYFSVKCKKKIAPIAYSFMEANPMTKYEIYCEEPALSIRKLRHLCHLERSLGSPNKPPE